MNLQNIVNKSTITVYRVFAIVTMYGVLASVLMFALLLGFYAVSTSWVAPVILSEQDTEALDLTNKILSSHVTLDEMELDIVKTQEVVAEARNHLVALKALHPKIEAAIARENEHRHATGQPLVDLARQKDSDNARAQDMLAQLAEAEASIDKDLAAGLITKVDTIEAKTQFAKTRSDLTDSKIARILLKDSLLDKTGSTTTYMETLDKKVELESEITVLENTIQSGERQIAAEKLLIDQFRKATDLAAQTPLAIAMQLGRANLALVPYDNQQSAVVGAPVYDCYLSFVGCRQVGQVKAVFAGEQHAVHPIFRTDIRGFLVQLDLSNAESAKSKTLFLGSKPLLF